MAGALHTFATSRGFDPRRINPHSFRTYGYSQLSSSTPPVAPDMTNDLEDSQSLVGWLRV